MHSAIVLFACAPSPQKSAKKVKGDASESIYKMLRLPFWIYTAYFGKQIHSFRRIDSHYENAAIESCTVGFPFYAHREMIQIDIKLNIPRISIVRRPIDGSNVCKCVETTITIAA